MKTYRYQSEQSSASASSSCIALLVVCFIFAVIGAFCWPYTINTWLHYCGKPSSIVWWQGAILGFVPYFGRLALPLAVLTWLLMMFL